MVTVKKGELFFTPMVDHAMVFTEDTVFYTFDAIRAIKKPMKPTFGASRSSIRRRSVDHPIMNNCRRREDCRLCGSRSLERVCVLAPTLPANAFISPAVTRKRKTCILSNSNLCADCGCVQLGYVGIHPYYFQIMFMFQGLLQVLSRISGNLLKGAMVDFWERSPATLPLISVQTTERSYRLFEA